jgi:hypothetical protein
VAYDQQVEVMPGKDVQEMALPVIELPTKSEHAGDQ